MIASARKLAYRFLALPYVVRIEIASDLELLTSEDNQLTEHEKHVKIFNGARDRSLLAELWDRVMNEYPGSHPNPYRRQPDTIPLISQEWEVL